jgi:hypothetical protein
MAFFYIRARITAEIPKVLSLYYFGDKPQPDEDSSLNDPVTEPRPADAPSFPASQYHSLSQRKAVSQ